LRSLHSEDQHDPAKVEIRAILTSNGRDDALLEQLVGRLSLEPGVTALSSEIVGQDDGAKLALG
ncbi:MAG TPA: MgtC/SapB family protein, partial [Blastocatellia bacterium]